MAKLRVGVTPEAIQLISQAKNTTNKRWKARIKTADAAAMLMQGAQDDLENIEKQTAGSSGFRGIKSRGTPAQGRPGVSTMPNMFYQ